LHNALHRFSDEFQIALIRDLKFDLVPDVGKKRPGIIPNDFIEHFFVGKANDAAARMVSGNILTAKFPQGRVEITDIDYVTSGIADFNSVANTKWLPDENKNPGDETLHRSLHGQTNDDRTDPERGERAVPIYKDDRDDNYGDQQASDEQQDTSKRETGDSIFNSSDRVNPNCFRGRED